MSNNSYTLPEITIEGTPDLSALNPAEFVKHLTFIVPASSLVGIRMRIQQYRDHCGKIFFQLITECARW
jgi:hypothetical protein